MSSSNSTAIFFAFCDQNLECLLQANNAILLPEKIPADFGEPKETQSGSWTALFSILFVDGYIKKVEGGPYSFNYYSLTSKGRIFIDKGGYSTLFKEEEYLSKLKKEQITSVIDTNLSVKKTNKIQKLSLLITGIIIFLGLVTQGFYTYFTSEQLSIQRQQIQMQRLTRLSDSLIEVGLKVQMNAIQKRLDEMQSVKKP